MGWCPVRVMILLVGRTNTGMPSISGLSSILIVSLFSISCGKSVSMLVCFCATMLVRGGYVQVGASFPVRAVCVVLFCAHWQGERGSRNYKCIEKDQTTGDKSDKRDTQRENFMVVYIVHVHEGLTFLTNVINLEKPTAYSTLPRGSVTRSGKAMPQPNKLSTLNLPVRASNSMVRAFPSTDT